MKIIKRNGSEADFDINKIIVAVSKANAACKKEELSQSQINEIAEYVEFKISKAGRALSVEEIQDILGCSRTAAYNLVKKKVFHSVKVGGNIRISCKSFDAWLEGDIEEC